ncbi:MAG: Ig-like domain-containing protein [bacterium]
MNTLKLSNLVKGLGKVALLVGVIFLSTASAANATVYFSINAGADGGNVTATGGIAFENGGVTRLDGTDAAGNSGATGSLVQYIRVGSDGVNSGPDATQANYVSPNDVLVASKVVGNDSVWLTFSNQDGLFYHSVAGNFAGADTNAAKIYVRVWNRDTIANSTYYVDSGLLTPNTSTTVQPQPNDVGTGNLTCSLAKPVANVAPNAPASLAQAVANNAWVNANFNVTMSMTDTNNPDTLTPQVEVVTGAFTNTPNMTGTAVAYSGAAVTGTVSINVASLSDGTYKWQARVRDAASATSGFTAYSGNPSAFRVDKTGPTIGTITSPSSPRNNTSLSFSWTAATDSGSGLAATAYYYLRDASASTTASTVRSNGTNIAGTSVTVTGSAGNNYLHIVAVDALGNVSSVAHSSLVVVDTTAPTISSTTPSNNATNVATGQQVVINFSEAINTGSFAYSMNPDPGGRSTAWSNGNATASISHNAFNTSTSYTVTVTAAPDAAGNALAGGGAANPFSFTTAVAANNPPTAPALTAPANSATGIAVRPTFTWNASTDPDAGDTITYSLVVSPNANLSNPVINQTGLSATNYPATADLANNNLYYWRVTAVDNRGGSTNSSTWSFTTIPGAVTLTSIAITPANPTINVSGTQQFTAIGTYSNGTTQTITTTVNWNSATTAVATINTSGLATGVFAGTSVISASLSGVTSNTQTLAVQDGDGTVPTIDTVTPDPATIGQTMIISGSNFGTWTGSQFVAFVNNLGDVGNFVLPTSWSDTSITVNVPSGLNAGTAYVVVGLSPTASASKQFTIDNGTIEAVYIDDFEGGCVGNYQAPANNSGYYSFDNGITPANATINADLRQAEALHDGSLGAKVKYSYTTGYGGGWGAALATTRDLSSANYISFNIQWDGSTNDLKLGFKDSSGHVYSATVPNATLAAFNSAYGKVTLNKSAFSEDTGDSTRTAGAIDWSKITNYNFIYATTGTTANYHYIDSLVATVSRESTPPTGNEPLITLITPPAAPAGTRIVVTGLRFGDKQSESTLAFNNLTTKVAYPANIIAWSDTSITAIVPQTATIGTYEVKVTRSWTAQGVVNALESLPADFQVTSSSAGGTVTSWPNPFNAGKESINLAFTLPAGTTNVGVYIFDMTAKLVNKQLITANQTTWNGNDMAGTLVGDGAYIIRVINEDNKSLIAKGKILVVKR